MPSQVMTLRQQAEVVTDLSRGRSPAQVAQRKHLPVSVVEGFCQLYPTRAALSAAAKKLNKQLREPAATGGPGRRRTRRRGRADLPFHDLG